MKESVSAFDSVLYIEPPSLWEDFEEDECVEPPPKLGSLPSVSPFFNEKFMQVPTELNPVTGRLINFDKENSRNATIVTGKYRIIADKKELNHFMSGIKKPNT